ncbi:MAG: LTA synthase family protein [Paludibacteraceae bacterium]|nr:LTA synthase family protein [Paludibacteraceae bacterium]
MNLKRTVGYLLTYYLYFLLYFLLFKLLFVLLNMPLTRLLPASDIVGLFVHGLRMDLSAAAYVTVLPGLLLMLSFWQKEWAYRLIRIYTIIILTLLTILGLTDMALYSEWGSRLNTMIFTYLKDFGGVIQSLTTLQWVAAIALFAVLMACFIFGFNKMHAAWTTEAPRSSKSGGQWLSHLMRHKKPELTVSDTLQEQDTDSDTGTCQERECEHAGWKKRLLHTAGMLLLTACLILPIRGGVDTSPLTYSMVYFSENLYANHAAYNFFWNFMYAVLHRAGTTCPVNYMSAQEAEEIMRPVFDFSTEPVPVYLHPADTARPINVIVFLLESFSNRVVGAFGAPVDYAPNLSQLAREGISWDHFYATGSRSDKGFSGVFAGYPAVLDAQSVMKYPDKMRGLNYLPTYFVEHGYDVGFYYGGDIDFYNTKIFLMEAGVRKIVERSDFPASESMAYKWGAADHVTFARMLDDFLATQEPAMYMCFNLGSHNPYDMDNNTPIVNPNQPGGDYCNSIHYVDSCIGVFVDRLRESPKWGQTLCIFVADHTSLWPDPKPDIQSPEAYHIPMVWAGGVIDSSFVVGNYCMQTDLGATLIQQLGWEYHPNPYSKNMFGSQEYAVFCRDEAWGYVGPQAAFTINRDTERRQVHWGADYVGLDSVEHFARAYMQYLHLDFEKR